MNKEFRCLDMLNEGYEDSGRFRHILEIHDVVEIVFCQDVPEGDRDNDRQDADRPTNCCFGKLKESP